MIKSEPAAPAVTSAEQAIVYVIDDTERLVIVYRIEHRATAYRPR